MALGVSGIAGIILGSGADYLTTVGTITWNTTNNFVLSAVPMFMFMGELIVQSGLSSNFYKGLMKWCRRIPGGLLHANVIACAFYSAISGSSVATAAGIGSIAVPETKKRGYPVRTIYGSIAASGTLGILAEHGADTLRFPDRPVGRKAFRGFGHTGNRAHTHVHSIHIL